MNTLQRNFALLLLLACSVLFLPACGGGGNVQSNKAPETVLNTEPTPEATPVSSGTSSDNTSVNTYVEKSYVSHIKRSKGPNSTTTITTTPTDATPVVTPVVAQTTPVAETPKKSGGSHWFLWLLVALVLLGIGWYFWAKNQEDDFGQPKAPTGGLSPVSGFTAVKDQIEEEAKSDPSIWTKKLF